MRVAIVSNLLPPEGLGGAERYVAELARSLSSRHDVLVLSGSRSVTLGRAVVERNPSLPSIPATVAGKVVWHVRDQWSPAVYRATSRRLLKFQPDVVAIHSPQGLSAGVFTAARRHRFPVVHTLHDYNALCVRASFFKSGRTCARNCPECRIQRLVRGRAIAGSSVIVGCSQYVLDVHSSLVDLQHTPQVLNYPGVPLGEPRETASRGPTPTVGFIGTLAPHKGVQVLLEAWRQAPGAWRLLVAGSGVLERDVARAASELRSIEVLGEVTGEAKERFFSRLDALVVPSVWEEPFGQVGIEALVRGVPVVAARRGGLAEIPLARLFEPTRADELIAALGDVLTDDYFERFRERALAERERWSLERNVRAQEDILESVARGDVV